MVCTCEALTVPMLVVGKPLTVTLTFPPTEEIAIESFAVLATLRVCVSGL
jgi:hypothetical protein